MKINIGINGYGRIGRNILRALYESSRQDIRIKAINDVGHPASRVHLTQYDTTHGVFKADIQEEGSDLMINGDRIRIFSDRNPANIPWGEADVDVVLECTGRFTSRDSAAIHLQTGAKKVIISAPATQVDATIVYGVNHHILTPQHEIISNASCTTNCLAPIAKVLHEAIGIKNGLMTTIHAYTNDQVLLDTSHADLRRARSATHSMIPTKTGAAAAVGLVLPELEGKLDGLAIRVPVMNVSAVDLTFLAERPTSILEINRCIEQAAANQLAGVIAYNTLPLVSIDFNHHPASAIFDATQTRVIANTVKVIAWYDNEWGFSHRMLDTTVALMQAKEPLC